MTSKISHELTVFLEADNIDEPECEPYCAIVMCRDEHGERYNSGCVTRANTIEEAFNSCLLKWRKFYD